MTGNPPEYYVRLRENGAAVFHIDPENRNRRIEMTQIAVINKQGDVKPHGDHILTEYDLAAIAKWQSERTDLDAKRQIDDILRTIDHLNLTASWVQQKATDKDLNAVTDPLLMAMHDLRQILVKKQAARLANNDET
ncbi:MAG: hypothetical protein HKP37_03770 [Boseongicola sp.]|nr:hypothetical protein [Boseongicola sp.]